MFITESPVALWVFICLKVPGLFNKLGIYFCSFSEGVHWTDFGMFRRTFGNFEKVRRVNMTDR